jgi:hypothetical protein
MIWYFPIFQRRVYTQWKGSNCTQKKLAEVFQKQEVMTLEEKFRPMNLPKRKKLFKIFMLQNMNIVSKILLP